MRHDSLDVEKIRNLVKSNEGFSRRHDLLAGAVGLIKVTARSHFSSGGGLTSKALGAFFRVCDGVIRNDAFRPLQYSFDRKMVTTARQARYSMLVPMSAAEGFDDLYQLVSVHLWGTKKSLRLDVILHPMAFQYHAAERLMERTNGVDDALDLLGANLSKWMPFAALADTALPTEGGFCLPVGDNTGMMIGEFTDKLRSYALRLKVDKQGVDERHLRIDRRFFVARTFVSRHQLRPAQAYAMNLLTEWAGKHECERHEIESRLLWPWSFGSEESADIEYSGDTAFDELDHIMKNPVLIRSMHAGADKSRTQFSDDLLDLGVWGAEDFEKPARPRERFHCSMPERSAS